MSEDSDDVDSVDEPSKYGPSKPRVRARADSDEPVASLDEQLHLYRQALNPTALNNPEYDRWVRHTYFKYKDIEGISSMKIRNITKGEKATHYFSDVVRTKYRRFESRGRQYYFHCLY